MTSFPWSTISLKNLAAQYRRRRAVDVSLDVMAALSGYEWPGNIRELENMVERMVLCPRLETLGLTQLPPEVRTRRPGSADFLLQRKNGGSLPCHRETDDHRCPEQDRTRIGLRQPNSSASAAAPSRTRSKNTACNVILRHSNTLRRR